LIYIAHQQQYL